MISPHPEPLFGAWLLKLRDTQVETQDMPITEEEKTRLLWPFGALAVLGLFLIILPDLDSRIITPHGLLHFLSEVGFAVLISAIIGFFIERHYSQQLVNKAFLAALKQPLNEALQDEVVSLYREQFLCTTCVLTYSFQPRDQETVCLDVSCHRTSKNLTLSTLLFPLADLGVEVGPFPEHPARIREIGYRIGKEDKTWKEPALTQTVLDRRVRVQLEEVTFRKNEELTVWWKYTVLKGTTDGEHLSFSYATKNPLIIINQHKDLNVKVTFGHKSPHAPSAQIGISLKEPSYRHRTFTSNGGLTKQLVLYLRCRLTCCQPQSRRTFPIGEMPQSPSGTRLKVCMAKKIWDDHVTDGSDPVGDAGYGVGRSAAAPGDSRGRSYGHQCKC